MLNMKTLCVIPARYASTRLPGKPLALIGGRPMIQWVYERAGAAELIDKVIVATDNDEIKATVEGFGGNVKMTSSDLASGTDRTAAALEGEDADIIVNLQGDEPFIEPSLLSRMVQVFANPEIEMATPIKRIVNLNELTNPNFVRVVRDNMNFALYFSRAVVPFVRDIEDTQQWLEKHRFYKHIGIYAYRKSLLLKLTALPQSSLEQSERLEQLRALENGIRIYTVETEYESTGVDTPEDLEFVNKLIQNNRFNLE